jgi:hypothetical protein
MLESHFLSLCSSSLAHLTSAYPRKVNDLLMGVIQGLFAIQQGYQESFFPTAAGMGAFLAAPLWAERTLLCTYAYSFVVGLGPGLRVI